MTEPDLAGAASLLRSARRLVALTGAGLSVESGIPPFRGPGGLWTKYGEPSGNAFQRFLADPKTAWEERLNPSGPMRELWSVLAGAEPNPGHRALVDLERQGHLAWTITQNVDDLHRRAGSERLLEIHGNANLVRCLGCVGRWPRAEVDLRHLPPRCPDCGEILKSDTVSFGEPIPADVLEGCREAVAGCDVMLVVGTSATVHPAARFPLEVARRKGFLVEVNACETELTPLCAMSLRGPAGELLPALARELLPVPRP